MAVPNARPPASLSSGLLARKGAAKPAMRSQALGQLAPAPQPLDDLGWNDMGDAPVPPVVAMQESLREEIEASAPDADAPAPVSPATAARIGRESAAQTRGGKAAFTLRLDAPRHLRLRLASAVAHRSAQALVCDALDRLLDQMPEVEALVAQLPEPKRRRSKEDPR
jgi:hypothetical protein